MTAGILGVLAGREEVAVHTAERLRRSVHVDTRRAGARHPPSGASGSSVATPRPEWSTSVALPRSRLCPTRSGYLHPSVPRARVAVTVVRGGSVAPRHGGGLDTQSRHLRVPRRHRRGVPDRSGAVTVHHAEGAGCYGHNGADDVALDAGLLARAAPGRPVRVQWSREDEFACAPFGPAMAVELGADVSDDGEITWWQSDTWSNAHVTASGLRRDRARYCAAREIASDLRPIDTDDRGGIARNAITALRLRVHMVQDAYEARHAGAHLVIAITRRVRERLRHRVVHRRVRRAARRRSRRDASSSSHR